MSTPLDSRTRGSLLLAAGNRDNQEARAAFTECYAGLIHDWCRREKLQKADQDDVVQTILCRLFEMLPTFQYDPSKRFRGLLRTMISRAIVDLHRVRQRRPGICGSGDTEVLGLLHEVPAVDDPAVEDLAEELTGQIERDQQLHEACERVRRRVKLHTWQAFWLTTVEDKPVTEVAQQLEMTQGAVLVAKHRMIKMIRSEVEGMAGFEGTARTRWSTSEMCYSEEDLRRFLNEELNEAASASIETHIDDCSQCLEALQAMGDKVAREIAGALRRPPISPRLRPTAPNPDRAHQAELNLLFGALALQNNFIGRDDFVAAFAAWTGDKSRPLAQILVDRGALDATRRSLLNALVAEHLKQHDDNPAASLGAVSLVGPVREDLERLGDADRQASVTTITYQHASAVGDAEPTLAAIPSSYRVGDRFRILRFHKKGGLGQVWVALDNELGREVALKEILPDLVTDSTLRSRFVMEAEINGGLEHPGIVPVYSLGTSADGRPFYAMRFVEGESLEEAVESHHKNHPRPDPATVEFRKLLGRFIDVCEAIAFAHSRGVLHRDLKPNNIMLGRFGETLLIDWGLAKATGRRKPVSSGDAPEKTLVPRSGCRQAPTYSAIGTPAFMSPEQAALAFGQDANSINHAVESMGPATDVYGLGAVLFALLTGEPPVEGKQTEEILDKVKIGAIRQPRALNPNIPRALEAVCLKALATQPSNRYPSALALAKDVECWLADKSVKVYRAPWYQRLARWGRHHQSWVGAAVTMLLLTTIFAVLVAGFVLYNYNQLISSIRFSDETSRLGVAITDMQGRRFRSLLARLVAPEHQKVAFDALNRDIAHDVQDLIEKNSRDWSDYKMAMAHAVIGTQTRFLDPPGALASFQRASSLLASIAHEGFEKICIDFNKVLVDGHIAALHENLGDYNEALSIYKNIRARVEALLLVAPKTVDFQHALIQTRFQTALIFWYIGQRKNAMDEISWAYSKMKALSREDGASDSALQEEMIGIPLVFGYMEAQVGRTEQAKQKLIDAQEASDAFKESDFSLNYQRACIAAQLGDLQGEKGRDHTPDEKARRERFWDQAMKEIGEAHSNGLLGQGTTMSFYRLLLDPLRSRKEFQVLEKERAFAPMTADWNHR